MNCSRLVSTVTLLLMAGPLMSATWRTDFEQAKTDAAAQHKLIILKFSGSDWCIPCIRMEKEIFSYRAFLAVADTSCILVNADFPRAKKAQPTGAVKKENELLAERYNKDGHFPLTLLLSADGKVLKQWDGYTGQAPAEFIAAIKANRP